MADTMSIHLVKSQLHSDHNPMVFTYWKRCLENSSHL